MHTEQTSTPRAPVAQAAGSAIETKVETSFSHQDRARSERIEREIIRAAAAVGSKPLREGYDQSSRHLTFSINAAQLDKFCELVKNHVAKMHAHTTVTIKISASFSV